MEEKDNKPNKKPKNLERRVHLSIWYISFVWHFLESF